MLPNDAGDALKELSFLLGDRFQRRLLAVDLLARQSRQLAFAVLVQLQLQVGKFADIAIGALEPLLVLACRIARLLQPLFEPRHPLVKVG